ncbi:MAG: DNA-processing protein DprA [Candidatus Delongbacteria bacterium]|nr:DNA-processing protein DprA [Candidatus Delongbacteria bacterium]
MLEPKRYDHRFLLKLMNIPGLGPSRIQMIVEYPLDLEAFIRTAPWSELKRQFHSIPEKIVKEIKDFPYQKALDRQLAIMDRYGIGMLSPGDPEYPLLLSRITAPPPLLFYRGNPACLTRGMIAVIGTRRPSTYGIEVTRQMVSELVKGGNAGIVSGLAEGLDTVAHRTCLEHGGWTVSILGTGPEHIYPAANHGLAEEIIKQGAIVTQFLPGSRINPGNFALRNRMISGISCAVLIMEAGLNSGSLITARFAAGQNRPVFAVPGSILSSKSEGNNDLIRNQSAQCLTQAGQIMKSLPELFPDYRSDHSIASVPVTAREYHILKLMEQGSSHLVDIRCSLPGPVQYQLYDILLKLELKGLIRQLPGMDYQLVSSNYQLQMDLTD